MQPQGESADPGRPARQGSGQASSLELVDLLEERVRALVARSSGLGPNARDLERELEQRDLRVAKLTKELQSMAKLRAKVLKQVESLIKQLERLESKAGERR